MQATPLTWGCVTVAIVLGVIGMYLNSLAAVAGAMGLAGLLCGQGVLFLYRTVRFADGLQVERAVNANPVWLGASVEVEVRATTMAVPGLQVRLDDLPPRSAIYDPDETVLRNGEGRYQIRFMTPGDVSYRGILLGAANRFFTTTIPLAAPLDAGETWVVRPIGDGTSTPATGNSIGLKERPRTGFLQGAGVRGYRPFRQGDDPAKIDWKLTAKYGRPFVREPTSEAGNVPLLVVDLPVPMAPGAVEVLSAASVEIRREIREYGQCTLLVIAGAEVVAYSQHESNLVALLRLLGIHPPDSVHPLYRVKDPVVLIERLRWAEREPLIPSQHLASALRTALRNGMRSVFEREVDKVLDTAGLREVIVYTASSADVSHLNLIAAAARRRSRRLVIRSPPSETGLNPWLSPYPHVEGI